MYKIIFFVNLKSVLLISFLVTAAIRIYQKRVEGRVSSENEKSFRENFAFFTKTIFAAKFFGIEISLHSFSHFFALFIYAKNFEISQKSS